MDRIFYVEEDSISGARACRQPDRGVNGDVMALVGRGWLIRAVGLATHQAGYTARPRIHEDTRAVHDCRVLRRCQRHLDHVNAEQRGVRIFVWRSTRTS